MNLSELLAELYIVTSRPDLVAESTTAIKAATLKLHGMDYFYKDLVETTIIFDAARRQQAFDYKAVFPYWRNVKYLRKIDPISNEGTTFLSIIPANLVTDSYQINREDVAYMAGTEMNIRSTSEEIQYLLAYYRHPDITEGGWTSWIADEVPYAIVYEAARHIFKTIGKDEEEIRMRDLMKDPDEGYYKQIKIIGLADMGGV